LRRTVFFFWIKNNLIPYEDYKGYIYLSKSHDFAIGKYQWQIPMANANGDYQWQMPMANTNGRCQWQLPNATIRRMTLAVLHEPLPVHHSQGLEILEMRSVHQVGPKDRADDIA
jgi:hypothetical protein